MLVRGELTDGFNDTAIAGATAKIAIKAFFKVMVGGIGILKKKRICVHDETWGAITTLGTVMLNKGFLDWVDSFLDVSEIFNCC